MIAGVRDDAIARGEASSRPAHRDQERPLTPFRVGRGNHRRFRQRRVAGSGNGVAQGVRCRHETDGQQQQGEQDTAHGNHIAEALLHALKLDGRRLQGRIARSDHQERPRGVAHDVDDGVLPELDFLRSV